MADLDRDEKERLERDEGSEMTSTTTVIDESAHLSGDDRLAFDRMVAADVSMANAVKALDCVLKGKEGGYPRKFPFPTSVAAIAAYIEYRESLGETCPDTTVFSEAEKRRTRIQETMLAVHHRDEQNASEDFAGSSSRG